MTGLICAELEFDQIAGKWQETTICMTTVDIARKTNSEKYSKENKL